jgi:glycosyltransferase involved in cell wall biosynthesis
MTNDDADKSMNKHTVSVIIPAYNSAVSLGRSVDSALGQTHKPAQVIVINDGSTDETAKVARSYGERIVYLEQDNQGQGAARNTGLRAATGAFVAFLDADDYWLPHFLGECVEFLEKHEEAVAVSTGILVKLWGKKTRYWPPLSGNGQDQAFKPCVIENFFDFWAEHDHVRTGSVLIRRKVIEEAGFQRPDLRISQDLEYWAYLATFGKWGFIPRHCWVGDPTPQAAVRGWMRRYRKRRALCPSVDAWEQRILPRLRTEDQAGFRIVRGKVAASFALSKILAGNDDSARRIVEDYGNQMKPNRSTRLMRLGLKFGGWGWRVACEILRSRERLKAFLIWFNARSMLRKGTGTPPEGR